MSASNSVGADSGSRRWRPANPSTTAMIIVAKCAAGIGRENSARVHSRSMIAVTRLLNVVESLSHAGSVFWISERVWGELRYRNFEW